MTALRGLLSSPQLHRHSRSPRLAPSLSVPVVHDHTFGVAAAMPIPSTANNYLSLGSLEVTDDDCRPSYSIKDGKYQLVRADQDRAVKAFEGKHIGAQCTGFTLDQYRKKFERQLLYQPVIWSLSSIINESSISVMQKQQDGGDLHADEVGDNWQLNQVSEFMTPLDVLSLAKEALVATREASLLAEQSDSSRGDLEETYIEGVDCMQQPIVRSKRLLERRLKKRKLPKSYRNFEASCLKKKDIENKIDVILDSNDPLKLFLRGSETKKLLTAEEENDIFCQIEELTRYQEIRCKLRFQFDREPTLAEWAESLGMNPHDLQSFISSTVRSRDKLIFSNFRLVVRVARQYIGKGLSIHDLLQEGSRGLLRSLEKFKPKQGCRFPTYSYWWIRQFIRIAIFKHSRIIKLPETTFAILKKAKIAKCTQIKLGVEPTLEDIARHVGVTTKKLESVLMATRNPLSFQKRVRPEDDATFEDITADPDEVALDIIAARGLMRQQVREFLSILSPRERMIIEHRFGIGGNRQLSLREIGDLLGGLTKERIRQLESNALQKLKESLPGQGLDIYTELLV